MIYSSMRSCINDLEKNGHLIRIKEEVDPNLEMAAIHMKMFENKGPAILFEKIKNCEFQAVSNLFGTEERSQFIFRNTFKKVQRLIDLKNDPLQFLRSPFSNLSVALLAMKSFPRKRTGLPSHFKETTIDKLPLIKCWPDDGGAFITLPQVYSEDPTHPGVMNSNLGMYRVQLTGNNYETNKEVGLHYQIHRGIGVHQSNALKLDEPLKVSIFVGGPPSHTLAAIMPLPEGLPELTFAGALGGKRFNYTYQNGYCISTDADFIIIGEIHHNYNKPEGPFGDHLGYYSLKHSFPVLKVNKVYHRKNAIWPFTVVGRPPQEDTQFGNLIHQLAGSAIQKEIPGLHEVNAVDAAGVHPLLLAIGSERYTPYDTLKRPQELLTIANHILGKGQLSLAKYLFIANKSDAPGLSCHNIEDFLVHILERVDWSRDLHFHTKTTMDTLDYSDSEINEGSKVVIAATGEKKRNLRSDIPIENAKIVMPGVLVVNFSPFKNYEEAKKEIESYLIRVTSDNLEGIMIILLADDPDFVSQKLNNFLWTTFTRSNPATDIYGVGQFLENKHWGCSGPLVIDIRKKPHHAPPLVKDQKVEKRVDALFEKYAL